VGKGGAKGLGRFFTGRQEGVHDRNAIQNRNQGQRLAMTQSGWVADRLREQHPDARVELVVIKTKGDILQDVSLSSVGGKGLFVKEIEEALLRGEVDLAVHSMKDLPRSCLKRS